MIAATVTNMIAAAAVGFLAPTRVYRGSVSMDVVYRGRVSMDVVKTNAVKVSGNFEITDSISSFADKKLAKPLETFGALLTDDLMLHLKVESRALHDTEHKGKEAHIAEATVYCVDKHVINAKAEGEDMYASIDELADTLTRSLRKYKEKRIDLKEGRKRASKGELAEGGDSDEELEDESEVPAE